MLDRADRHVEDQALVGEGQLGDLAPDLVDGQTKQVDTLVYRDPKLSLYGLANGTIRAADFDGDHDVDLLLNGEDFFALPASENNLNDAAQAGGATVVVCSTCTL